tara:strand:- start:38 stop:409 length:372 start_codon:yes stop_codon:yes gene_type:complete
MKITKSQLKQIIKEELEEAYGRHDYGAVFDPEGEPEISSPYRKKPKRYYGSQPSQADIEARKRWEEKNPKDRRDVDFYKRMLAMPGMMMSSSNPWQQTLIDHAQKEIDAGETLPLPQKPESEQ